jgi:N-methylhydantoinase B/oxoprolinase/acetone carboxylase alpha subunit
MTERDPAAIERDISEGFITAEGAREKYGYSDDPAE